MEYNYNILTIDENSNTMIVEFSKENCTTQTVAMRLPYENEDLSDYLKKHAPIGRWTVEQEEANNTHVVPDISLHSGTLNQEETTTLNDSTNAKEVLEEVYANTTIISSYSANVLENTIYKGIHLTRFYNGNDDFIAYDAFATGANGMRSGLKVFSKAKELGVPIFTTTTLDEIVEYTTTHLGCVKRDIENGYKLLYLPWNDEMQIAKNNTLELEMREKRNELLLQTDYWELPSSSDMTDEQVAYRQALRDITNQESFPTNITWPTKP